jgi:diphthine-ammonia ligase
MHATHFLGAVAFVSSTADTSAHTRVTSALQSWKLAHQPPTTDDTDDEQDDDFDVWDQRQFGSTGNPVTSTQRKDIVNVSVPPCFVAEVESLPRDAPIEWASIGVEGLEGSVETTGIFDLSFP